MRLPGKMVLTIACFILSSATVSASGFKWYMAHDLKTDGSVSESNIDDTVQKIELKDGWSCVVRPTSFGGWYEARQTTCQNDDKIIDFSVQCESNRPKDHAQIRFRNPKGKHLDFIEVGCAEN